METVTWAKGTPHEKRMKVKDIEIPDISAFLKYTADAAVKMAKHGGKAGKMAVELHADLELLIYQAHEFKRILAELPELPK